MAITARQNSLLDNCLLALEMSGSSTVISWAEEEILKTFSYCSEIEQMSILSDHPDLVDMMLLNALFDEHYCLPVIVEEVLQIKWIRRPGDPFVEIWENENGHCVSILDTRNGEEVVATKKYRTLKEASDQIGRK